MPLMSLEIEEYLTVNERLHTQLHKKYLINKLWLYYCNLKPVMSNKQLFVNYSQSQNISYSVFLEFIVESILFV